MGKPKEKPKVTLPKADEVTEAKPLVEKLAKAKARFAKVREKAASPSDAKHRAARKRVKRAQRRLRERLEYAATRQPKPKADAPAAAEAPASA
jgi:hypothetical protein